MTEILSSEIRLPVLGGSVLLDKEDLHLVADKRWRVTQHPKSRTAYAVACRYVNGVKVGQFFMHREICGASSRLAKVDHLNHDGLDNRRANLRICDHASNMRNRLISDISKSGFKGVSILQGRWRARLTLNKKEIHLGYFDTPKEAALAYDRGALVAFGEFALTNKAMGVLV